MIQPHLLKKKRILMNLGFVFFLAGLYFPLLFILPIQFQSVDSDSAAGSGLRLIPLVLGISVFTMVSNAILTFWRHYLPFLVVGGLAGTAGAALIYNLDAQAPVSQWILCELLAATGIGLALQIPMISNQAEVSHEDIASVTALSLFMENMGTSLFVASGEAAFTGGLIQGLKSRAPEIDPIVVVEAGATQIRNLFDFTDAQDIVSSYLQGCRTSYILSIACGAAAASISIGAAIPAGLIEWKKWLRKSHDT